VGGRAAARGKERQRQGESERAYKEFGQGGGRACASAQRRGGKGKNTREAMLETCPVSTEGGTRRVQLVREGGGRGARHPPCSPHRPGHPGRAGGAQRAARPPPPRAPRARRGAEPRDTTDTLEMTERERERERARACENSVFNLPLENSAFNLPPATRTSGPAPSEARSSGGARWQGAVEPLEPLGLEEHRRAAGRLCRPPRPRALDAAAAAAARQPGRGGWVKLPQG